MRKRAPVQNLDRVIETNNRAFTLGDVRKAAELLTEAAACLDVAGRHCPNRKRRRRYAEAAAEVRGMGSRLREIYRGL